jgi:acetolactate decarboxylase
MHSAETLSQFSTIDALMQGIYDGAATFGDVKRYGDFGLGTVNHLDGEMLALDGIFYQITSDGRVHVIPEKAKTSFATVVFFQPEHRAALPKISSFRGLQSWLDRHLGSRNYFWSVRIHGTFSMVRARSISSQKPPYKSACRGRQVGGGLRATECDRDPRRLPLPSLHQGYQRPRLPLPLPQ